MELVARHENWTVIKSLLDLHGYRNVIQQRIPAPTLLLPVPSLILVEYGYRAPAGKPLIRIEIDDHTVPIARIEASLLNAKTVLIEASNDRQQATKRARRQLE